MPFASTAGRERFHRRLLAAWQQLFAQWMNRRIPPARQAVLGHRNIFILPNRQGLGFMLVLALMFIGAVNYESNLAFALVFLLLSMFVVSIFHTFRNLAGLRVSVVSGTGVFAGEMAELIVILHREGRRSHESVRLCYPSAQPQVCDLISGREARVSLFVPAVKRGWLKPGRLVIDTVFPFGICRAWSLLDLRVRSLVYPAPLECDLDYLLSNQLRSGNTSLVRGSEDFYSLREYRLGDPLRHVAWKNYASGQGMLVKEYASTMDQKVWLRWEMFAPLDTETRLSHMCWCALRLDEAGLDFGLALPGFSLPPGRGEAHYRQVLESLALFGSTSSA
ncbi:MAG TPA: DUF58 domain-containing protein [Pseudomonadaceae bacterium]|nr:DUF58 domain-containing protein [Pseudomonadaceae bacterium]